MQVLLLERRCSDKMATTCSSRSHRTTLCLLVSLFVTTTANVLDVPTPRSRCEPVTVPLCADLYNQTTLLTSKQEDAKHAIEEFSPLIQHGCSRHLKLFLCSLYVPECELSVEPEPPCKNLCIEVKDVCEPVMQKLNFKWPHAIDCLKFQDNGSCIGLNSSDLNTRVSKEINSSRISSPGTTEIGSAHSITPVSVANNFTYASTPVQTDIISDQTSTPESVVNHSTYKPTLGVTVTEDLNISHNTLGSVSDVIVTTTAPKVIVGSAIGVESASMPNAHDELCIIVALFYLTLSCIM